MQTRSPFAIAFATTFLFCSSPQAPSVVVAPAGPSTTAPRLSIATAHAAPSGASTALAKDRAEAAKKVVALHASGAAAYATVSLDELALWQERAYRAQQDVLSGQALVDAATERVAAMKNIELLTAARVKSGSAMSSEMAKATYYRADAEIELARLTAQ